MSTPIYYVLLLLRELMSENISPVLNLTPKKLDGMGILQHFASFLVDLKLNLDLPYRKKTTYFPP